MKKYRKPLPLLEKVKILDAGSEGKAVARVGDLVVFVPFVIPGDVVDIQVVKKKKSFLEGRAVRFHEYSELRVDPFCQHFGMCGGCRWQNLKYNDQLFFKQKQVKDAFERIGKLDIPELLPIVPSPVERYYRNKLEYTFSNRRWLETTPVVTEPDMRGLGFHLPMMYDRIIDVKTCYLQPHPSDAIRQKVRDLCLETGLEFYNARDNTGFFRNLLIRNSNMGDVMIILVVAEDRKEVVKQILDKLSEFFPEINSLFYVINEKKNDTINDQEIVLYKGKGYLEEKMDHLVFRVGPISFFQVNTLQAVQLYRMTRDLLNLRGDELIYDLYTGTGTIANFVAGNAQKVVGVEYVEEAVKDAHLNSQINQISNTEFYAGDLARVLNDDFLSQHGRPDVIITDPPRAGMGEKVVEQILQMKPEKIAYISCNPATQARDLAMLSPLYKIVFAQAFDMFPHTQHVECLVVMVRRD
ncbi:MAG: 23S rRNA (uracil(1939)-C(5))-methyltransferase RlmD [Bacteroidales bacterium]